MATSPAKTNADWWMDVLEATGLFPVNREVASGLLRGEHGVYAVQRGDSTHIGIYAGVKAFNHGKNLLKGLAIHLKEWAGVDPTWVQNGHGYWFLVVTDAQTLKAVRWFLRNPARNAPVALRPVPDVAEATLNQLVYSVVEDLLGVTSETSQLLGAYELILSVRKDRAIALLDAARESAVTRLREAGFNV